MDAKTIDALKRMAACPEAIAWVATQPDLETAWRACERGDWMAWLVGKLSGPPGSESRNRATLMACRYARLVLHLVPDGEDRPRIAIETAEALAWGAAGVTLEDVRDAAASAASVASAAYTTDAGRSTAGDVRDAAASAASAASAAYTTDAGRSTAVADIAYAAYGVGDIAYAVDAPLQCADIAREFYPEPPELPGASE